MIRAKIPIRRTAEGQWKADASSIDIDTMRQITVSPVPQEELLGDLVETIMGEVLLSIDKTGRRGTSDPIQWEITVDGVPFCYRCVEPMDETHRPADPGAATDGSEWKCVQCGAVIQVRS